MASFKQELFKGVFWSAVEKYSGLVIGLVVSMVLARMLEPREYGIVAIATVLISFLQMFCTLGIGPAIIQHKDLTKNELDSIFTFSISIGSIFAILFFCSSWSIASFYDNEQLITVCQILSLQLLFASANMVPSALMARDKKFKDIAKRTLSLQILTGIISVFAAFRGAGVYSLLISPVLTGIGIFAWNRRYYKVNIDWKFNLTPIKRIFAFSSYQFLFNFVNYFSRNLDKLIIGRWMSAEALGIYEKSYRLMQLPLQNITGVINPVMQPVLRDISDNKQNLGEQYAKIVKLVATLSFPSGIILSGMSYECINFFYGENWNAAIPVFSILALSLPFQMILSTSGAMYLVCNNTKVQFWVGIRNTITTVLGFCIAAIYWNTIEAMAWAWTLTLIINFICSYYFLYKYVLKITIIPFIQELIRPTIIAIIVWGGLHILNTLDCCDLLLVKIIIKGTLSIVITLLIIQITKQYDLIALYKARMKKGK